MPNQLTEQELIEARDWISDCEWPDLDPEEIEDLSDEEVEVAIARHYEGGILWFKRACSFDRRNYV